MIVQIKNAVWDASEIRYIDIDGTEVLVSCKTEDPDAQDYTYEFDTAQEAIGAYQKAVLMFSRYHNQIREGSEVE